MGLEHVYDITLYNNYYWLVGHSINEYKELNQDFTSHLDDQLPCSPTCLIESIAELWRSNDTINWKMTPAAIGKTTILFNDNGTEKMYKGIGGADYRFVFIHKNRLYIQLFNYYKGVLNYVKASNNDTPLNEPMDRSLSYVENYNLDEWILINGHSIYYDFDSQVWNYIGVNLLPENPNPDENFTNAFMDAEVFRGTGWHPLTFKGKIVYLNSLPTRFSNESSVMMNNYGLLYSFDFDESEPNDEGIVSLIRGELDGNIEESVLDYSISENGDILFILEGDGDIFYTYDLSNWTFLYKAPDSSLCLEVSDNKIYVGGKEAQMFYLDMPQKGDLNYDGTLDISDMILSLKVLSNSPVNTNIQLLAESNNDGKITIHDSIFILKSLADNDTNVVNSTENTVIIQDLGGIVIH